MMEVETIKQFLMSVSEDRTSVRNNEIALVGGSAGCCSREQLLSRVQQLSFFLKSSGLKSWALSCSDFGAFIVSLLALIKSGKTILLPANDKPGTLQECSRSCDALLSDSCGTGFCGKIFSFSRLMERRDGLSLAEENYWDYSHSANLIFYTSGSSGYAQAVWKTLAQLEQEVVALETLWGAHLGASTFLSCVSHQHIYGFLFRLLWPLLTNRAIDVQRLDYPEQVLNSIGEYQLVTLVASPAQLKRLPLELDWQRVVGHLRAVFSSGVPLAAADARIACQCFAVYPLEVLGSTETGGIGWRQQNPQKECAENWTPFPFAKIVSKGKQLHVFSPWLESPDEGFVMADTVRIIDVNRFMLLGRVDSLVKIEGKRVSLTEVKRRLLLSEFVSDAEAVVVQSARVQLGVVVVLSEEGRAYLASYGRLTLSRQLKQLLGQYFEIVTLPKKWRYVDQVPVNSQGKTVRKELECLFI